MRDAQIIRYVRDTAWAIHPAKLPTILDLVALHAAGVELSEEEVEERIQAARRDRATLQPSQGSVGVLPLTGVIVPRAGLMTQISGGCSLDTWCQDLYSLLADPNVGAIVLDVDSPGGSVDMVPETAQVLLSARKQKPIVAVANTEAASAAYWLASCCSEVVVTPSGQVGSIGVYSAHQDISQMEEAAGIKTTLISAGRYKTEGSPFEPLSDEAKAAIQEQVDTYYGMFVQAVAAGRNTSGQAVIDGFGQGRMVTAEDAVKEGMADRVATLSDTVARLQDDQPGGAAPTRRRRGAERSEGVAVTSLAGGNKVRFFEGGATPNMLVSLPGCDPGGPNALLLPFAQGDVKVTFAADAAFAGAIAPHSTGVIDEPWDGPGQVAALDSPVTKTRGIGMFAWFDSNGDDPDGDGYPDAKDDWKFPHHKVTDGDPGPANVNGVRNALSRLTDSKIPEGDKAGVRRHLQRHLDDFDRNSKGSSTATPVVAAAADSSRPDTRPVAPAQEENQMKTIEELAARQDEIRARQEQLDAEFAGAMFSDEARAEFDQLQAEYENLVVTIADIKQRKATLATKATKPNATLPGDGPRQPLRGAFSSNVDSKIPDNIWDLSAYRTLAGSVDELARLYRDGARRAVEIAHFPSELVKAEDAKAHVEELLLRDTADGLVARHVLVTGKEQYRRGWSKAVRGLPITTDEKLALDMYALTIGTPSDGGFAIPYTLDPTVILASNGAVNPIRQMARQVQIVGHQWLAVTTADGVVASYGPELQAASDNSPTLAQPTLEVEKAQAFVPLSIEASQDWVGVEAELAKLFADAKDVLEATKFMSGAGHASHEPEGLLTFLVANNATSEVLTAAVATFARDDIYSLENELAPRFEPNAAWLANRAFYNAVRSVTDDTFNIFIPIQEGTGKSMGGNTGYSLLGYPAWRTSAMTSQIDVTGHQVAILGDFEQMVVIDRIGMSVEFIPHLFDTGTGYPIGSRGLYCYWRNTTGVMTANAFRYLQVQ